MMCTRSFASTSAALLLVLSASSFVQPGVAQEAFNCSVVCFSNYFTSFSRDCDLVNYVLRCYNDHLSECQSIGTASITQVQNEHSTMSCPPWDAPTEPSSTAEPVTTAPPPSCPAAPPFTGSLPPPLAAPDVVPAMMNPSCVEYDPQELQHCSLFGYSTLRPFRAYRSGIEACNIPGSWFLLRHWTVSIEVEGVANGERNDHTKLSKVNVTFYPSGSCLRETKSYVATSDSPLSQTFSDLTLPSNCSANLHLQVDNEGTLVTMMAPWINTTVVIRRLPGDGILAVTVQVPKRLSNESYGLCKGCPAHAHLIIRQFKSQTQKTANCSLQRTAISTHCFVNFAINSYGEFYFVDNASYSEMCLYSMWRHNSASMDFLGFLRSVGNDAKLLRDRGNILKRLPINKQPSIDSSCSDKIDTTNTTDSASSRDLYGRTTTSTTATTEVGSKSTMSTTDITDATEFGRGSITSTIDTTDSTNLNGGPTTATTDSISTTDIDGGSTIDTTDSVSTRDFDGGTTMSTIDSTDSVSTTDLDRGTTTSTIDITDFVSTTDLDRETTMPTVDTDVSTAVTTSERERPVMSTTVDDAEMISSATGRRCRCIWTQLLAISILSTVFT